MPSLNNDITLRSEEVQEVLSQTPNWMIRWGSLMILIIIIMVLSISYMIKYPDTIVSECTLTTSIPPQKIYARHSEKFEAIFIKDNEIVQENSPLAIIKNNARYEDVFYLKNILDTTSLRGDSFYFPIDEIPILSLGDIATDYFLFENNYSDYILHTKLQPYKNEKQASIVSGIELQRRLNTVLGQKNIASTELELLKKDVNRYKTLFDKGVVSIQEYENKKLGLLQAKGNYENLKVSISQIRESLEKLNTDSRVTEINKAKDDISLLQKVIQSFNQLKKSIKAWESQYVLISDIKGKVCFLNYWSVNQTVNSGDLIFTVVPVDDSKFLAKLNTPAMNSGKIKIGQKVFVKIHNYPDSEFGVLEGEISRISETPNENGEYLIDADLPSELITSYNKKVVFKQEMKGSSEIITEDLRLIERFFQQLRKLVKAKEI